MNVKTFEEEYNHLRIKLGWQIRTEREKLKMTQAALAQKAGTTTSNISLIERAKLNPTFEFIQKVLYAMDLKVHAYVLPRELCKIDLKLTPKTRRLAKKRKYYYYCDGDKSTRIPKKDINQYDKNYVIYDDVAPSRYDIHIDRDYFENNYTDEYVKQIITLRKFFGRIINSKRVIIGWKQDELAERAGTTQEMISNIEHGKMNPSLRYIQNILFVLGESMNFNVVNIKTKDYYWRSWEHRSFPMHNWESDWLYDEPYMQSRYPRHRYYDDYSGHNKPDE